LSILEYEKNSTIIYNYILFQVKIHTLKWIKANEFEDLNLIELFNLEMHIYSDRPEIIKSSKNKDVLFEDHYYDQINILNTSNVEQ